MSFEVRGGPEVQRMLRQWMEPVLPRKMQGATKAGADVFKGPVKLEAARVSSRLARSVSVRKAKRDRPATILTFRPKVAYFRHWIIRGTKDHGPRKADFLFFIPGWNPNMKKGPPAGGMQIRTKRVRGMEANPIIGRVASRLESQAYSAFDRFLDREAT